jgi:hypothetical protein
MITVWKILNISAESDVITEAKYFVKATDEVNVVETEGNWHFDKFTCNTPFANVTEKMVIEWIKAGAMRDGRNVIESRLEEQLALLTKSNSVASPWKPPVFTLEI